MSLGFLMLAAAWTILFSALRHERNPETRPPAPWLMATVLLGALVVFTTEAVGAFAALRPAPAFFVLTGSVVLVALVLARGHLVSCLGSTAAALGRGLRASQPLGPESTLYAILVAAALLLTLCTGLATAPNTWDSLTYHLPRVMQWVQNQTLAHYPTPDIRQLCFGTWSSQVMALVYLFDRSDRWLFLVQWLSLAGCALASARLSSLLWPSAPKEGPPVALLAGTLAICWPMALIQSTTTQSDVTMSFWLLAFVTLVSEPEALRIPVTIIAGLALGIGFLTKAVVLPFAIPFALRFGWKAWRSGQTVLRRSAPLGLLVCMALLPNVPFFLRNVRTFGSPLGDPSVARLHGNGAHSPAALLLNVTRNLSLHAATGIPPLTRLANRAITVIDRRLGGEETGRAVTYPGTPFVLQTAPVFSDGIVNLSWPPLIVLAGLALFASQVDRWGEPARGFPQLAVLGFVLFCGFFRWQAWNSRFHLALFLLCIPAVACVLASRLGSWGRRLVVALLALVGIQAVLVNRDRPLLGPDAVWRESRSSQYCRRNPDLEAAYRGVAQAVHSSGCRTLGLYLEFGDLEYPLWAYLKEEGYDGSVIHLASAAPTPMPQAPMPCAVLGKKALLARLAGPNAGFAGASSYGPFLLIPNPGAPGAPPR